MPEKGDALRVMDDMVSDCEDKHNLTTGMIGEVTEVNAGAVEVNILGIGKTLIKKNKHKNVAFLDNGLFEGVILVWKHTYGTIENEFGDEIHLRQRAVSSGRATVGKKCTFAIEGEDDGPVAVDVKVEEYQQFSGEIITWNEPKGFGFIKTRDLNDDIFVHIANFEHDVEPYNGMKVKFTLTEGKDGKPQAEDVKCDGAPAKGKKGGKGRKGAKGKGRYEPYQGGKGRGKKGGKGAVVAHTIVPDVAVPPQEPNPVSAQKGGYSDAARDGLMHLLAGIGQRML
eukprot:gene16351-7945_t